MADRTLVEKKVVVNGDGASGKTCFIMTSCLKQFPGEYIPTVYDNHVYRGNSLLGVEFWDTAGGEDYDRLRPLSYPKTELFITIFSVISRISFNNVREKWIPEIRHHMPKTPIILVGTKVDLREDKETQERLKEKKITSIPFEEAWDLSKELKLDGYVEISSLRHKGIEALLEEICFLLGGGKQTRKKKSECIIS
eukprot:TRINITY_DN6650_c1_g1_i2.p1 TRINITY_DN6650_c1_g1~~TRINITY_DN6650_c1_g1_i2.p1  ORF type:complete len:195 (-),score=37.68 TRINITY_DN6650_c1_g1_i2:283-867(-)